MPRRGAVALSLTAFALVLLLNFQTPADVTTIDRANGSTVNGVKDATRNGADTTGGTSRGSTDQAGSDQPDVSTATTITGPTISTRWGPVQVMATVEGARLVDVSAVQLPGGDRRSASISARVEPVLRSQALEAQSADIDGVSGATYTSQGYARSLQAALDDAGIAG